MIPFPHATGLGAEEVTARRLSVQEMRLALDSCDEYHAKHGLVLPHCTDDEGRALAESKVDARIKRAPPLTLRACPYAGSRFRHASQ